MTTRTLGIIGGLGALAGADLFAKLLKSPPARAGAARFHFLLEQHPFKGAGVALERDISMTARKLYVFQASQSFVARRADAILLPCFASHVFRDEIQAELEVPLLDMMAALLRHIRQKAGSGSRLGILTSDFVHEAGLFERYFGDHYTLVYPAPEQQADLMHAVYGERGLQAGDEAALEPVAQVCRHLLDQGADLLVPGFTELSLVTKTLQRQGIELLDSNEIYAEHALHYSGPALELPFKLGIVGGVGPAATVDFMDKVVRNTPAGRDQEHIKMVVEQNPQIPDRTANLLHEGTDPTVALLATCRRLEAEGAKAIAIPCNTAHAFVAAIQPCLATPIVNMLTETIAHIRTRYGGDKPVGLLATAGTVQSRVYHAAAEQAGIRLIVPEPAFQSKVMNAIYGEYGVKAGFIDGECKADLLAAAEHLAQAGAEILILGCTELPLLFPQCHQIELDGRTVALIDPTDILARRCVQLARPA